MNKLKDIVVIYHAQCTDGFSSAYAAWKKYGDTASYLPRKNGEPPPEGLSGKTLYILDYSYNKETLEWLGARNTSVVVIDHHATAKEAVCAFPQNIFDGSHSGAVLSWKHFHPQLPVPTLFQYVEDIDLWNNALPHYRAFGAALGECERDFRVWDALATDLQNKERFLAFIARGEIIAAFEARVVERLLEFKERARFEGHELYVLNASRVYRSILGNMLAEQNEQEGGIAAGIVYYRYGGGVHCSLRSIGEVDVGALAARHGGGGHKNAASIRVPTFADLPFAFVPPL